MNEIQPQPHLLKPMDIGDILDNAISLYRKSFWLFLGTTAVVQVPFMIIQQAIHFLFKGPASTVSTLVSALFAIIWVFTAMPIGTAAMTKIISEKYLGKNVDILSAYKFVFKKFKVLFIALTLQGLFIMIGFLFLIVPGVLCILWFLFVSQIVMLEETTAMGALKRSKKLFQSSPGKTLLVLTVVFILVAIFQGMASAPLMVYNFSSMPGNMKNFDPSKLQSFSSPLYYVFFLISSLATLLVDPIRYAPMTLLYYDIRIRKEGFDLQVLAQSLGYSVEKRTCSNCGREVLLSSVFCGNCGAEL